MGFGSWQKFKTYKKAKSNRKKLMDKGYFVSEIEFSHDYYWFSVLTKKGKNPFYVGLIK